MRTFISGEKFLSWLTIKLFSKIHLAYPCGQLQIPVELESVDFGAGAAFLISILSGNEDVKLISLRTVMLVFQQFPVHSMLEPCWFLGFFSEHPTFYFI